MTDERSDWPFDQTPNTAAFTVRSILRGDPILHVSHDADDHGWQFLDGRPAAVSERRVISMADVLRLDPSVRAIADLPPGWIAWRATRDESWTREPHAIEG